MSDLIERDKAIDALMAILDKPNHAEFLYTDEICKVLNDLPSAQPKPQWIPCSERLPDKSGLYLTWTKFPYEEEPSWLIINYDADCEAFGEWEEHYHPDTLGYLDSEFNEFENVFAWMPLPESYKGE